MKRLLLLLFLVAVVASNFVRSRSEPRRDLQPEQRIFHLPEYRMGQPTGRTIEVACRDISGPSVDAPVLLLLHGSPVASSALAGMIDYLESHARLIVPDLPGFGGSTLEVADYSILAHAQSVRDLMDQLDIPRYHAVAYSMGGGPAIHLTELDAERLQSLVLVSSIGVQEFELLRDYTLNHALHGVQLVAIRAALIGLPHFGVLDTAIINKAYARNFYDTDQRPLRAILERYSKPMLLVHGEGDGFTPPAVAHEHRRIVPQAVASWNSGGHMTPLFEAAETLAAVPSFIRDVEQGEAPTRATAAAQRIAAAEGPIPSKRITGQGLWIMVLLLAIAMQTSEDLTCIGAGLLVAKGVLAFFPACLGCFLGIILGDAGLYLLGRWFGRPALKHRPLRWMLNERQVARHAARFQRRGGVLVFSSRFLPGARVPFYFAAGMLGMRFWKFLGWLALAGLLWTPVLVGLSALFGARFLHWFEAHGTGALLGLAGVILAFWLIFHFGVPLFTWRGRRLALGSWRRWTRWEYWPTWVIYPPVVLYCLWRVLRHRSIGLMTLANPGIPYGGLVRETKSEILRSLVGQESRIARWLLLPVALKPETRLERVQQFMHEHDLSYPVILKPDFGYRGTGVKRVGSDAEALDYLQRCPVDTVVQEFIEGDEFGVFYYRMPDQEKGQIFSVTDKRIPKVTGDGEHRLEHLILADDRAVGMAPYFLDRFSDRLEEVPAAGEQIALTSLGTHCRGSLFLDGGHLCSPELEQRIDEISRSNPGFFFGRYDLRVPDAEALQRGEGIKIIELNALTAESTNIYDPKHSLLFGWRTLIRQWDIAWTIAAQNRARGMRGMTTWQLFKLMREFVANPVPEIS